jgi:hypothetical protein
MEKLLLEIDLSAYYNKCRNMEIQTDNAESEMLRLLRLIYKSPSSFMVDPDKVDKIKLFAYYLIEYFISEGEKTARTNLETLREEYDKSVEKLLAKKQRVEQNLRIIIRALHSRITNLKHQILRYNNDVFQSALAGKFIKSYSCPYELSKTGAVVVDAAKHSSFINENKKYSITIAKHIRDNRKYKLLLPQSKKKVSSSKKGANQIHEPNLREY